MFKKMMKHLTNNPGLKILSILIAVVLWMIVVKFDEPNITKTYKVPVTVVNEEVLENMGKVYDVVGQSDVATISVTGKRSLMDKISASDFTATADLSQIDLDENLVPINVVANRNAGELHIVQKTNNMQITIEDLSTKQFYISVTTSGNLAEGYAIGEVSVSPNLIKVSGPQSLVSKIQKVSTSVNVEGLSEDFTTSVGLVLHDEDGNVIESPQLRLSQEKVTVSVQILGTKTVSIRCETTGTPAEGYQFVELEYAPETILIKGEPHVLNEIQDIVIPGEAIDIEGATRDVENSIDLNPYLPEGVSLVNPEENKVAVKAVIKPLETRTFELPVGNLEILNLAQGYKVEYELNGVSVAVRGRSDELAELRIEDIKGSIDLAGLQPGVHTVKVTIVIDEKYEIVGEVTLQIRITNQSDDETTDDGGETEGTPDESEDVEN